MNIRELENTDIPGYPGSKYCFSIGIWVGFFEEEEGWNSSSLFPMENLSRGLEELFYIKITAELVVPVFLKK